LVFRLARAFGPEDVFGFLELDEKGEFDGGERQVKESLHPAE
jgi:hypothetical protein